MAWPVLLAYLYQMSPIALGALALLLARSLRAGPKRTVLYYETPIKLPDALPAEASGRNLRSVARDFMIVNGHGIPRCDLSGMLLYDSLSRPCIITCNADALARHLHSSSAESCAILFSLAGLGLRIVGDYVDIG